MTKDETLKLALAVLKSNDTWGSSIRESKDKAITAIKQALNDATHLAAPMQGTVKNWCETCNGSGKVYQEHQAGCWVGGEHDCPDCDGKGYYTTPPAAPVQEPVLWLVNGVVQVSDIPADYTGCLYATPPAAQPAQEPVAWASMLHDARIGIITFTKTIAETWERNGHTVKELSFTSPPAQRKPLTDDVILHLVQENNDWLEFARAIEAAHGIKGEA